MRGLLVSLLLVAPLLAGCVGDPLDTSSADPMPIVVEDIPDGALVEEVQGGVRLTLENVPLPFREDVTIPEGTTLVRLTGEVAEGLSLAVSMRHAETERRRCNVVNVADSWGVLPTGRISCSGVTAVDRLPDAWTMIVAGRGGVATADLVEIEFLAVPVDGLMADLDLSQLSRREYELEPTQVMDVPSFDGTPLRVEVTLPKGEGPWPTVLWSSPYNNDDRADGRFAAWSYFVRDWAERGYAVVSADVRGYGESGGCVEVWGLNEQKDQVFLVEWVASQEWSDGNVGFYGQSYVATTPVEAAVYAPAALKAIVIVAPVNNAYDDWHFGGVPNGENLLSPIGYQAFYGTAATVDTGDPVTTAMNHANGLCDPALTARANDPRAVYDAFYEERNFSARAKDVTAVVLYTQGFEDRNVKSQMIPDWFNAITAPKLGLFGHWTHQHPTRADNEVLFLGWMDQYVKGKPLGFEKLPAVDVVTNDGTRRTDSAWPPLDADETVLHADFGAGALSGDVADGSATILVDPAVEDTWPVLGGVLDAVSQHPRSVALESEPLAAPVHFAGQGVVRVKASVENAENAYVAAFLYDVADGEKLVTFGMFNLAHRFGHDRHEPVKPGEVVTVGLPLLPTEYVFAEGTTLRLVVRGASIYDWSLTTPGEPATVTLMGGEGGTALVLPTVDGVTGVEPLPMTAVR